VLIYVLNIFPFYGSKEVVKNRIPFRKYYV